MIKRLLYHLYTKRLLAEVRQGIMPRHIGLILDGNRRYASGLGREPSFGHELGADKLQEVLGWCADLDIRMATVWVLSTENLSRPEGELRGLLEVIERKILQMVQDPRVHRRRVRIRAVGQLDLLPESTRQVIARAEEATQAYDAFALNIAVGYGGRQEIVDAVKSLLRAEANQGASLEEIIGGLAPDEISKYLYTQGLPDPDLIIRTSGEVRLSGFLLWQSAYSEFYFCDAFWPAFRKIDFLRAIRSFQQRERRYGR